MTHATLFAKHCGNSPGMHLPRTRIPRANIFWRIETLWQLNLQASQLSEPKRLLGNRFFNTRLTPFIMTSWLPCVFNVMWKMLSELISKSYLDGACTQVISHALSLNHYNKCSMSHRVASALWQNSPWGEFYCSVLSRKPIFHPFLRFFQCDRTRHDRKTSTPWRFLFLFVMVSTCPRSHLKIFVTHSMLCFQCLSGLQEFWTPQGVFFLT